MSQCQECYKEIFTGLECGDMQLKEKDGQYGPPKHGERAIMISVQHLGQCEVQGCKQKARFKIGGCMHNICGYCLKKMDVIVNFVKHEPQMAYACPECVCRGGSYFSYSIRWVEKKDVYRFLSEKNICISCFQIKTFDAPDCKHGICCICLKKLLNNADVHEYICVLEDCHVKYDFSRLQEMYEKSISEMDRRLFAYPGMFCSNIPCGNLPLLKIRKCFHNLCWECITKGMLPAAEINKTEYQDLMRCPVQTCKASFPSDCLKYHVHRLMSTMQLATIFFELEMSVCCRCPDFKYELSINLRECYHKVCLTCFEKYILEIENRKQGIYLDLEMEITKCFQSSCEKKAPTACFNAMSNAMKGDPIAAVMYLQSPKGKQSCSWCDSQEVFVELAPCQHCACKPCTIQMYEKFKMDGLVTCEVSSCRQHVPVLSLRAVLDDQKILQTNINYFEELTKKSENAQEFSNDNFNVDASKGSEEQCNAEYMETDRGNDLLLPSYGEKMFCSYCPTMAVIKFSRCSHGWCLRCLKFQMKNEQDDKLQCENCTSCGSVRNAKRVIRNFENDGLLVASYLKPVSGSTCCDLCKRKTATLEEIHCGHRFCDSCLNICVNLKLTVLGCPYLNCQCVESHKVNEDYEEDRQSSLNKQSRCDCCSKKEAVKRMKCGHSACKDCVQQIFPCPIKSCKSFIDCATSAFLSKHLSSDKDTLFISKKLKPRDDCCVCSGHQLGDKSEREEVWQIRRCNHIICKSCFTKLLENCSETGMSTCPSKKCVELFFTPKTTNSYDLDTKLQMDDNQKGSKVFLYKREVISSNVQECGTKAMTYSFQSLKVDDYGVKHNGLPNLHLSCYKNSVFQVLAETPSLFSKIRDMNKQLKENWTFTLCEILWRVQIERSSKSDIEDWLLRFQAEFASIDNSFVEYTQHDSLSFLTSVLSGIAVEAQKGKKEGSMIDPTDIFRGELHDQYTCCKCKKPEYHGENNFFSLPLPTVENGDPKIGECLYQFLASETLKDVFPCSFCEHDTVRKEIQIKKYPDVLVLQLGMISETREQYRKVHRTPKFWENFAGLTNNIHLTKIKRKDFLKYKLYGVIVHIGGLTGGHYYAYVKKMQSGKWECRDDSYVRKVGSKEVLQSDAYILFYHKIEPSK